MSAPWATTSSTRAAPRCCASSAADTARTASSSRTAPTPRTRTSRAPPTPTCRPTSSTPPPGHYVLPPFTIIKRQGIKVGVIGVTTTETPSIVIPDAVAPFKFLDLSDSVNAAVAQLHRRRIHTIVVLAPAGGFMTPAPPSGEIISETAQMDPDVDLVV